MGRIMGKQSIAFDNPPYILEGASIVGQKEGEGPMGKLFDVVEQDPMLGQDTWEDAESLLQKEVIQKLLFKSNLSKEDIRYLQKCITLSQVYSLFRIFRCDLRVLHRMS